MKKNTFLDSLIEQHTHFVFISPHQDDVALSCGTLISKLIEKKKRITIINVFTKAHRGPYTLSAKKFLQVSGEYSDAAALYKERKKEDERALSNYNATIINLDLVDALFRKKQQTHRWIQRIPELTHVYPTYKFHIKKGLAANDPALGEAIAKLKKALPKSTIIFAPFNIANHVDHLIAKLAAEAVSGSVVYYADFPYTLSAPEPTIEATLKKVVLPADHEKKQEIVSEYKTQINGLFSEGKIPVHQEVFFIPSSVRSKRNIFNGYKTKLSLFISYLGVRLLHQLLFKESDFLILG